MIDKDISQYLSLEQRARNLFGENYDLENCVEELRKYRNTTLSPEQVRTLQTRFADVSLRLGEYMAIGTPEECLRNKDFLDFLSDKMDPDDFEMYLHIYNSLDEKGNNNDGE